MNWLQIANTIDAARLVEWGAFSRSLKTKSASPVDRAREVARHSASIPQPVVIFSYVEGHLF